MPIPDPWGVAPRVVALQPSDVLHLSPYLSHRPSDLAYLCHLLHLHGLLLESGFLPVRPEKPGAPSIWFMSFYLLRLQDIAEARNYVWMANWIVIATLSAIAIGSITESSGIL